MQKSTWQIKDANNNKLGLIATETFLVYMDVILRGKQKYGDAASDAAYLGDVEVG